MAETIVGHAWVHRLRKRGEAVVIAEEKAPSILEMTGRPHVRRGRVGSERRRCDPRNRIMRGNREAGQLRGVVGSGHVRVSGIERIGHAIRSIERGRAAGYVGQQQRVGIDQHRFSFRMRQARHLNRGEQAVACRFAHGAGERGPFAGEELRVLGEHLHQVADAMKFDDVRAQHRAYERLALADAVGAVDLEEQRMIELFRLDLQPDLVLLGVEVEQARLLLGILDDIGEGFLLSGRSSRRRSRRCRYRGRIVRWPCRRRAGGRRGGTRVGVRRVTCGGAGGGGRGDCGRGHGRRIGCRNRRATEGQRRQRGRNDKCLGKAETLES